jgi:DHA2 family multidrug resistance protein
MEADSGGRPWITAVAVMLPTTLAGLSPFTVSVALEHIGGAFSAAPDEVTLSVSAHIVAYSMMLPVSGWLARAIGQRRLFGLATLILTASSAAAGAAPGMGVFMVCRMVQGLAAGVLVPISQIIMMAAFPGRRPMALALWSLGVAAGSIAGSTLGGLITEHLDWHWIFYLNVPFGVLALALGDLVPDGSPAGSRRGRLDVGGLFLLTAAIVALQAVLERGEREDWFRSPMIAWCALGSGAALFLFIRRERRTVGPLIDLTVLGDRTFTLGCALTAVVAGCQSAVVVLSALVATRVMDYDALAAGMLMAPAGVATAVSIILAGSLSTRFDERRLVAVGATVAVLGLYGMATLSPSVTFSQLAWPRLVFGLGVGLLLVSLANLTLGTLPPEQRQTAAGLFNLLRNLGASVGIAASRTYLERAAQSHQAYLAERIDPTRSALALGYQGLTAQLAGGGADPATAQVQGWLALYGSTRRQALFLAFLETYRVLAVILALIIPVLLLLSRRRPGEVPR